MSSSAELRELPRSSTSPALMSRAPAAGRVAPFMAEQVSVGHVVVVVGVCAMNKKV